MIDSSSPHIHFHKSPDYMILLNINWSRISCVWCYSCRWWAARCSELNFRCNNAFEAEYLFRWLSSRVCVSAVLTFSAGLHPWRRVDGVTEQTVTRHLQTHNSCTHRTCSTQRGRLTHLSWGKWGAPVPYTYFLLIRLHLLYYHFYCFTDFGFIQSETTCWENNRPTSN